MPGARMLKIVVMKLIAPRIDEAPARWIEKIAKSIAGPVWPDGRERRIDRPAGRHPGRARRPRTSSVSSSAKEATSSQNEMLFMRGKAMSGAPIIIGTNQLPNPPIIAGMTMKKIMIRPWAVATTL